MREKISVFFDSQSQSYVARIPALGITGYGVTEDAAFEKAKRMRDSLLNFLREE